MNINPLIDFRNFRIDNFHDTFKPGKLVPIGLNDTLDVANGWRLVELGSVESALATGFMQVGFMLDPFADLAADVVTASHRQHLLLHPHSRVNLVVGKSALVLNASQAAALHDRWRRRTGILVELLEAALPGEDGDVVGHWGEEGGVGLEVLGRAISESGADDGVVGLLEGQGREDLGLLLEDGRLLGEVIIAHLLF
jgi:hypothetical protein